jgi:hypothetical protein
MRRLSWFLAVLLGFSSTLAATVIIPAEFREIVSGSQIIVHGRVVEVRSDWVDGRSRVESLVTIEAAAFYRGAPAATLTFRTPGGQVGRYKAVTVGAPEFKVGDEAVLFLKEQGPGVPPLIFGLNQGLFRVRVDARTGRRLVIRQPLMARSDQPERVLRGERQRQPLTLDAFGAQVRAVLQQERAQ